MTEINASEFRENGFLYLRNFFRKEEVDRVRRDAQKVFSAQMLRRGIIQSVGIDEREIEAGMFRYFERHMEEFMACGKQTQHLISLHRMSLASRIEEIFDQLELSSPTIAQRPVLYFNSKHLAKKEFYWRTPPHQDWRSMQGSLDSIVLWIPLVDVDISLGAIQIVIGSHKLGLLAKNYIDDFGIVKQFGDNDFTSVEMKRGDVLAFSSFLVHRSGTNTTNAIRWSGQFRYNNLDESTFIQRGYPHPYVYKPQQELATPDFIPNEEILRPVFNA